MAGIITQWIGHVTQTFHAGIGVNLVASIPLDPSHPFYIPLKQALSTVSLTQYDPNETDISKIPPAAYSVQSISTQVSVIPADTRETFASFLSALLGFVKGGNDGVVADYQRIVSVYTCVRHWLRLNICSKLSKI
jgi:hypothetical protein